MTDYSIAWVAGPSTQIELFSPEDNSELFRMKFSPPLRRILRPPMINLLIGPTQIGPVNRQISKLVGTVRSRGPGAQPPKPDAPLRRSHKPLSLLLISVPKPEPRNYDDPPFEQLDAAAIETKTITDIAHEHGITPEVLVGPEARWHDVSRTLRDRTKHFDIVHFNGQCDIQPQFTT